MMLTEVLDRWEVLIELQQQKATWQQRWNRAQLAFEQSLQSIDQRDAQRLRRVLEESLPRVAPTPMSPAVSEPTLHAAPTPEVALAETQNKDLLNSAEDSFVAETNSSEPLSVDAPVMDDSEATLDDLLTWATEIVGDGVPENVLYQELRSSKYSGQARQLFDALKELDAFYETDDEVIRIHSLRSMGL